ncbi:transposase domain-containing protein [Streptomyces sp. NBC_00984]|uniref:transposase domain-containing protein n=1 Tax=Streptomyces sp. NBC_00984 TaxID=2903700 RepID=UPI003870E305
MAITRTVIVAAGRFAPGHLGELTVVVSFELIDAVLEETRSVQRRLCDLPSRVGVYFLLAMCLFPEVGYRVPEGGRVDEAEVRRGLAALNPHPAIRTEVKADGGRVGVLLSVKGNGFDAQDCLLARVGPGATEVWVPPRIQRMSGEGGCTVGNALDPKPSPH